eukprot:s624_g12.t1
MLSLAQHFLSPTSKDFKIFLCDRRRVGICLPPAAEMGPAPCISCVKSQQWLLVAQSAVVIPDLKGADGTAVSELLIVLQWYYCLTSLVDFG